MIRSFLAAITMITCLPAGKFMPSERDLQLCSNWFPVIGLLAGCMLYCPAFYAVKWFGAAGAVLILVLLEAISKGFHLDGLADTADAFLSSRPRERKLEIMHDSHTGTMGVAAIVLLLLGKFAFFSQLSPSRAAAMTLLCAFGGRLALTLYILISHYARPQGLGLILYARRPYCGALLGLCLAAGASWWFSGHCLLFLPLIFFVIAWDRICRLQIGGATGDTVGACEQLAELLTCLLVRECLG